MRSSGFAFAAACIVALAPTVPAPARGEPRSPATFVLDPVHSTIVFSVGHLGISRVQGKFVNPTGTYRLDFNNPSASMIDVSVKAETVDTGNEKRDAHLRSPDFFNVEKFPTITFVGRTFEKIAPDQMKVVGDLTLLGTTRPTEVHITFLGEGETPQGYKSGAEATFTIKRSDFGMTGFLKGNVVGDDVRLTVGIEGKRQDEDSNH